MSQSYEMNDVDTVDNYEPTYNIREDVVARN